MEGWKIGRLECWRVGSWKAGSLEGSTAGRLEGWKAVVSRLFYSWAAQANAIRPSANDLFMLFTCPGV